MDNSEVVNITKIKDGFFLGDEATAVNLDVIIQFKITHMINAAGNQIINSWESIGIKYLTLNWSENSNQNLFDQKDEIANRIVHFIDDSTKNGEGILVHSLRGQNRSCVVILIYLIKKFRWTLSKSLEFLTNKKFDVEIAKYFLNQLSFFESRLSKAGQGPKSNSWNDCGNENDQDEVVIKNTYLNGLIRENKSSNLNNATAKPFNFNSRRITWADNNNYKNRNLLCSTNLGRELIYQKDIKPVLSHKRLKPTKSSLKSRSNSMEIKKSSSQIYSLNVNNLVGNIVDNVKDMPKPNNSQILASNSTSNILSNEKNSSVNYSTDKTGNDLLKNYNHIGTGYLNSNVIGVKNDKIINSSDNYNISKSINFDSSINKVDATNPSTNFSHIQIGNSVNLNNNSTYKNNINNSNSSININNTGKTKQSGSNSYYSNNLSNITNNNSMNKNNQPATRQNNFTVNSNNPQQRSFSVDHDPNKQNLYANNQNTVSNNGQTEPKIIIASKYKNVIHNNYNNIYIQSPDDLQKMYNNNNPNNYENNLKNERTNNSLIKKETNNYIPINQMNDQSGYPGNQFNIRENKEKEIDGGFNTNSSITNLPLQHNKLTKSEDNQRMMKNNFFTGNNMTNNMNGINVASSAILDKKLKGVDYTTQNSQANNHNKYNQVSYGYQQYNNQNKPNINNPVSKQGFAINNYQPELNKKNNFNSNLGSQNLGILNRPGNQAIKQGPIKIQNEYERKPSTPDNINQNNNNISTIKLNNNNSKMPPNVTNSNFGTIKRSTSTKPRNDINNDRPSTAPQKENENQKMNSGYQSTIKRLPSPNLKSTNSELGTSQKNMNMSINMSKYRSPSPMINTSSTMSGSGMRTMGKTKWK